MIEICTDENLTLLHRELTNTLGEQEHIQLNNFLPLDVVESKGINADYGIIYYSLESLMINQWLNKEDCLRNIKKSLITIAEFSKKTKIIYIPPFQENVNIVNSIENKLSPVSDYHLIRQIESICVELEGAYKNFYTLNKNETNSQKEKIKYRAYLKSPMTQAEAKAIALNIKTIYQLNSTIKKKVILVDLDNTIWGGVVGEDGYKGIKIGNSDPASEIFSLIQKYLKKLKNYGVLLAAVSKNNYEDVAEAFEKNPNMILTLSDFVVHKINWNSKSENILEISKDLNLTLDSFVFFDDNLAEREKIKTEIPAVEIIENDGSPVGMLDSLYNQKNIIPVLTTKEDSERTESYRSMIASRLTIQNNHNYENIGDVSEKIGLRIERGEINSLNENRIFQLFNKTNQFNLTTRRLSASTGQEILNELAVDKLLHYNVSDNYSHHGLVGIISYSINKDYLIVKDFIMSCRVLGRGVEQAILKDLIAETNGLGLSKVIFLFNKTEKNKPAEMFVNSYMEKFSDGFSIIPEKIINLNKSSTIQQIKQ